MFKANGQSNVIHSSRNSKKLNNGNADRKYLKSRDRWEIGKE